MKKIIAGIVGFIMGINMIGFAPVSAEKVKEADDNIAAVVAKAKAIQDGTFDSSLGPYKINGVTLYRYILVRGEGDDVTFELVRIQYDGATQLVMDLQKLLN